MDLVEFLNARLDEDEAAARVAANVAGPDWTWKTGVTDDDEVTDYVTSPDGTVLLDTLGGIESEAPHVARYDPARALREVEAGRKLIWRYRVTLEDCERYRNDPVKNALALFIRDTLATVIRDRAAVWSDHPDYQAEWKP